MKENKKLIIIIIVLMILIISGTYAYFTWQTSASQETSVSFTARESFTCTIDGGGNIISSKVLAPTNKCNGPNSIKRTIHLTTTINQEVNFFANIWLKINTIGANLSNSQNFKYALTTNGSSCTSGVLSTGTFTGKVANDVVDILIRKEYNEETSDDFYLYIWLDSAETNNNIMNDSLNMSVKGNCTTSPTPTGDSYFTFDGAGTITGYNQGDNPSTDIVIPEEINDIPVTSIKDYAFENKGLTSVIVPSTVTTIGKAAFRSNNLTNVEIPSSVTSIGPSAFNNNQLPDNQAFIYRRTTNGIDYSTLISYGGATRSNVIIPNEVNGISLNIIDQLSFVYDEITSITIPNSVTEILSAAFSHNKLQQIQLPSNLRTMSGYVFNDNLFIDSQAYFYKLQNGVYDYSTLISYGGSAKNNLVIPNTKNGVALTKIADNAFYNNGLTGSITMPNTVVSVGPSSFSVNQLTSINISSSITKISSNAFYSNKLTFINIPNSVTSIGDSAFYNNDLSTITIPSSVTSIGANAFYRGSISNKNLKTITVSTQAQKQFDWKGITGSHSTAYNSTTGVITNSYVGNAIVSLAS